MVRVLLVCGSLQRGSANLAALEVARAKLDAKGVAVHDFTSLEAIPPLNPDRGDEPGEAVSSLRAAIREADAVLIAAPEYAGGVAGVVKNALDWIVGSGDFFAKPVALVSAGTTGGTFARKDLVRTLSWQGAHVIGSLGIQGPNQKSVAEGGARRFTDVATIAEIEDLAAALVASVSQKPSDRFAAVERLALDAGVETGPLRDTIAAQDALAEKKDR